MKKNKGKSQQGWINLFDKNDNLQKKWLNLMNQNPKRFVLALDNVWDGHWLRGYEKHIYMWRKALASLDSDSATLIACGNAKNYLGITLTPQQMRNILRNPANGTPIYTTYEGTVIDNLIGRQPDLCTIINGFETSDVYLRDNISDTGNVPSSGSISASPDIIVRRTEVADPNAEFGEFSGTKFDNTLGYEVEAGQNNYIYVRNIRRFDFVREKKKRKSC